MSMLHSDKKKKKLTIYYYMKDCVKINVQNKNVHLGMIFL